MLSSKRPQMDAKCDKENIKQRFSFAITFCYFTAKADKGQTRPNKGTRGHTVPYKFYSVSHSQLYFFNSMLLPQKSSDFQTLML